MWGHNLKFIIIPIFCYSLNCQAFNDCSSSSKDEPVVTRDDFPWNQSLEEISQISDKIYNGIKRLRNRAYDSDGKILLPIEQSKVESWGFNFNTLIIKQSFIQMLKNHVVKIRSNNFGQELIYSDIGHMHVFAFKDDTKKLKELGLDSSNAEYYERILHSSNTKFLYHTSEQLRAPVTDEEIWRKNNRTVIADALGEIKISPFTKSIENFSQFFSVYFNAQKNGCFNLEDENFDISLSSPK